MVQQMKMDRRACGWDSASDCGSGSGSDSDDEIAVGRFMSKKRFTASNDRATLTALLNDPESLFIVRTTVQAVLVD